MKLNLDLMMVPRVQRNRPHRARITTIIAAWFLLIPLNAQAELGDYSDWHSFTNLLSPVNANNPVRVDEVDGHYPLTRDDSTFADGFDPGLYYRWQTIQIDPATGASCGNGSPYKIFVNRSPSTSNLVVYMEGGGACWDEASCGGTLGRLGARNASGIPDNYLDSQNPGTALVSPFVFRTHPWETLKTQEWSLVYIPYCTGDVYVGDSVQVYDDVAEDPDLVWIHSGLRNTLAATSWIRNNLERPGQMLSTGCSAGGAGSLATYDAVRGFISPNRGYMINDSGPLFPAPLSGSSDSYPSIPVAETIRAAWGLDDGGADSPIGYLASRMPEFNPEDTGTLFRGIASKYPGDRMGHVHFWQDLNYSRFSYERLYPEIYNEKEESKRVEKITALWSRDTETLKSELGNYDNVGYYFPNYRDLNDSHCATIVDFRRGDIQDQELELADFIDDVINGSGPVLQASEDDRVSDQLKERDILYWLIDSIL